MKLVGLMLARDEDWVIQASASAASKWCDALVLLDHNSKDKTREAFVTGVGSNFEYKIETWTDGEHWDEMFARQRSLEIGRTLGGTHFAIVDSDEILTANLDEDIRGEFYDLPPGYLVEVPMLAMRSLDSYQDDDSVWSNAWITLGFTDTPNLTWRPSEDGYHHHHRAPYGVTGSRRVLEDKKQGGVMHLQFANERRLLAKHWHYAYNDYLRWPERENQKEVSWKYSQALERPRNVSYVPPAWWKDRPKRSINTDGVPWYEQALRDLIAKHGEEAFAGLNLIEKRPV